MKKARRIGRAVHEAITSKRRPPAWPLPAVVRGFDQQGVRLICMEPPPDYIAWGGVRDLLGRAAA